MSTHRQCGFTVVELMIGLLVAAILLAVAVPSFQTMIRNNRLATAANLFVTDVTLARSEAIKRARDAYVTAGAPSAGNEFGGGWTVWVDDDEDGAMDTAAGADERVRISQGIRAEMTLDSVDGVNQIRFARNGALVPALGRTFDLCDDRSGERGRRVSISAVGRLSTDSNFQCP